MKIGGKRPVNLRERGLAWLAALVLVFVLGLIAGSQVWHGAWGDLRTLAARLGRSIAHTEDLPVIAVDMGFSPYSDLVDRREQALVDGVYIPSSQDYTTATIRLDDSTVPVRMRFVEGPVDHLHEGEKWGFEVRTRQDRELLGLTRFYLRDPALNNGLSEWAFVHTLRREGILAPDYRFVRLVLNGDDRGIYALQEGFSGELLAGQGRSEGVIVRFDADPLWESIARYGGDAEAAYADPVANLSPTDLRFFSVDTFCDAEIAGDPELVAQRDGAIGRLLALQTGELEASDVFDVALYGRFLALVDLWGATQATSLVNLRYYYNPVSGRLEPIGFNANALGDDGRLSMIATYDDPLLQEAYVREVWRVSQPEYVDRLQADLEPEFRRLQRAMQFDQAGTAPPWDRLRERQEHLRRSVTPVQPVLAYLALPDATAESILTIGVGNVLNLPVEIVGFDIHGATFLPASRQWLSGAVDDVLLESADRILLRAYGQDQVSPVRYARFDVPLTEIHRLDREFDFLQEPDVQVVTRVAGLSATQMTLAQYGHPGPFLIDSDP